MRITRRLTPLPGEHVVAVHPPLDPDVDPGWRRRLNLFPGRALSDTALRAEQAARAGWLAARGQALSPGIISGLDVYALDNTGPNGAGELALSAGLGLTAGGEDVLVPAATRVPIQSIRVYAPSAVLNRALPAGVDPTTSGFAPDTRDLGSPLGEFIKRKLDLPRVGVLVLQPTVVELLGAQTEPEPCERLPEDDPFDDQVLADGVRLVYVAWPVELAELPLPPSVEPPPGGPDTPAGRRQSWLRDNPRWRNLLAYTIFQAEQRLAPDERLLWDEVGLPVALLAFDREWNLLFVDRAAVVRPGGGPRPRSTVARLGPRSAGRRALWQARVEQLAEHLADPEVAGAPIDKQASQFAFLPPAGLLPRAAVDILTEPAEQAKAGNVRVGQAHFFPPPFAIDVAPVPAEQLDLALSAAASMEPLQPASPLPDQVRLLVPVPQAHYEPRLLHVEQLDPEFQSTIDGLVDERGKLLRRRNIVRGKATRLGEAVRGAGKGPAFPEPDPAAVEPEAVDPLPPDPPEPDLGVVDQAGRQIVPILEELRAELARTPHLWQRDETVTIEAPALDDAQIAGLRRVTARLDFDRGARRLHFSGRVPANLRDTLLRRADELHLSADLIRRLGEEAEKGGQADMLADLDRVGLEGFIEELQGRIRAADDKIDFGFLRVQTDIYRLRQLMLGTAAGSRLAVSPALASIARGETAVATQERLNAFFQELASGGAAPGGQPPAEPGEPGPAAPAGPAPGGAPSGRGEVPAAPGRGPVELNLEPFRLRSSMARFPAARAALEPEVVTREVRPAGAFQPEDIRFEQPIVGVAHERTVTVAERLQAPPAVEARDYTAAGKHDVLHDLLDVGLNVGDIPVSGVPVYKDDGTPDYDEAGRPKRATRSLADLDLGLVLRDPPLTKDDEAAHFNVGVDLLDTTIAVLRRVEGRVQEYRRALAACQDALARLRGLSGQAGRRLSELDLDLGRVRHDLGVARALLEDERQRIAAINRRRDDVLKSQVTFLAYVRPRTVDVTTDMPVRTLNPVVARPAEPLCPVPPGVPSELRTLVGALRDAPLGWFRFGRQWLGELDSLPMLEALLEAAGDRHLVRPSQRRPGVLTSLAPGAPASRAATTALQTVIAGILDAQQTALVQVSAAVQGTAIQVSLGIARTWQMLAEQALARATLGDLIDGRHGSRAGTSVAAAELDRIGRAAACLYAAAGRLLPAIRLEWTERLSQVDAPVDVRRLAILPRWEQVPFLERQAMQDLVDWLFDRVQPDVPAAQALANDLVRVCILLASHAPVDRLLAGRVRRRTPIFPGGLLDIAVVDPGRLRVGMAVLLYNQQGLAARAVVEDAGPEGASARVLTLHATDAAGRPVEQVTAEADDRVQLAEADALGEALAGLSELGRI